MEEEDFSKLSVEDACVHKVWKARLQGYTEAKKIFGEIEDEKSADWNKFVGLVKKFVIDSHALCQEKGLEAVLVFVENCGFAGRTTGDVVSGIIQKALAASKVRTKELGSQVILMYIEIDKQDVVLEELLKGTESKNPKVTAACIHVLTQALKEFGPKVVNINKIMKKIPPFIEDRDQFVRQETKLLMVEMYHWIGPAIQPQLSLSLKPNMVTEIEAEYQKIKDVPAKPTRRLRSQQAKEATASGGELAEGGGGDSGSGGGVIEETDPFDLLDPVDILGQLNKEFYTKLESKKWIERKEVVEELDKLLQVSPKLENADYGDLLRALKKVIQKDSNVVVVGFAIKCVTGIAKGLKKKFHQYAAPIMPALFEKFKEKKQNVVTALREAVDAVYISTTLEALQEDILASLENKNPSVKAEVSSFLTRCFCKCTPAILTKKLLKVLCKGLTTLLGDGDPNVRENSAMALGTAMKVVGEKTMGPFLVDIDAGLQKKIKEFCDKAEVTVVRQAAPKSVKIPPNKNTPEESETSVKPKTINLTKPVKTIRPRSSPPVTMKAADAQALAKKLIPSDVYLDITSSDTESQNSACDRLNELFSAIPVDNKAGQTLLHLFETHDFSVASPDLILRLNLLKIIAEKYPLPRDNVNGMFYHISNHLTNTVYSREVGETLTAFAKRASLTAVAKAILPDNVPIGDSEDEINLWVEKLNWICSCMKNVDILHDHAFLTGLGKKACEHSNSLVSNTGVKLIGFVHIKLDSQKDLGKIDDVPVATIVKSHSASPIQEKEHPPPSAQPTEKPSDAPKVDIGPKLTEALLSELADKNWKVRSEAVDKVRSIINSAESITPNLGDAAPILAARILDSNGKISANAIALVQSLAPAMGPGCKRHINVFLPVLMKVIGDQKTWIRSAVITCFNVWGDICGYDKFFEGELIADALKSGTPAVRAELWSWLAAKLPDIPPKSFPKEELTACLSTLYANLEDRNADVRKNASEATLGIMLHIGYNTMVQALENIKGSGTSARLIKEILDKTRGSLPVQPLQKSKSGSIDKSGGRLTKMAPGSSATIVKKPKASVAPSRPSVQPSRQSAKKEEEDDQPLLQVNNLKNQRFIDEQKMKVLKWTFTSVRPEFVDLLREQMITANVNKTLLSYMFHADFRYHLRAIESLNEDLLGNKAGLKSNLDLILRWMTLKFYDTNPSVLLKGLEYLNMVFSTLIDDEYSMLDSEAAAFIPSLIIKAGDPKDAVRNSVRLILKQMASVYPASKQFAYLMDGLKSKNSRQRSECLDQLSWLIETYGVTVFHPTMPSALKEIAKQIADRDNAVRSCALNCVVQAYYLEGDKVYKMVGQISDKDMSLLEERIKRASKNRPLNVVKPLNVEPPVHTDPSALNQAPCDETIVIADEVEPEPSENIIQPIPPQITSHASLTRPSSGAYGFDRTVVANIEGTTSKFQTPKLVDIDLQFLKDSTHETTFRPIQMTKMTPTVSSYSQPSAIKRELVNIASGDIDKAISAINKIDTIILSEKRHHINGHVDHFISQLSHLIVILNQSAHPEVVNCYNTTFSSILRVCGIKELCCQVSEATLYKILEQFLLLLTESNNKQNMQFGRVVNNIVIRFLENSNKTNLMCALLKILYSCVNNPKATNHFKDLVVKCLWKLNKSQPEWDSELDYSRILSEFHTFLKDYPTAWWKNEEFDFPLRTVKTILHSMVKIRGAEVREIADKMPNVSKDSELYLYIKKVIKHLKIDEKGVTTREASKENIAQPQKEHHQITPVRLTKEEQDELSSIFRMIGDCEESAQGMKRLYTYLKNHPEANVEPFLSKTNPPFQNYIKKNLQALEEQHSEMLELKKENTTIQDSEFRSVKESEFTEEAGVVWNKLKSMQEISGIQCDKRKDGLPERLKDSQNSVSQSPGDVNMNSTDIASIIARVEKFKKLDQN